MELRQADIAEWVTAYERAWRTAGTDRLADLFTPGATYQMAPFEEAHRGFDAIAELWEAERAGPDEEFTLESESSRSRATRAWCAARSPTRSLHPHVFRDLWIVRLDDSGRCSHFEEWPFWPEQPLTGSE